MSLYKYIYIYMYESRNKYVRVYSFDVYATK